MEQTMKALVYEGPKAMRMRTLPVPEPKYDEVIVRVERVGICGSELSGYLGHNSLRKPPLVMGHEFAGTVHTVGSGVTSFKIGARVTANPLISCLMCRDCMAGKPQLCKQRQLIGAHCPGAFAEYVSVPARNVYPLDDLAFDEGALAEPFACGVHICRILNLDPADQLMIMGAGPIGLFALIAAQQFGLHNIVVMDLNQERLSIVEKLGGKPAASTDDLERLTPSDGFDVSIDAVGRDATRQLAVKQLRQGGRVCFSGLHEANSPLPINSIIRNETSAYGAFAYAPRDFECALEWLKQGKVNLQPWIELRPLGEGGPAFEKLLNAPGSTAKILLHL
ncbi:zinc-dependent alcohol dehydrogenase [Paenibacillus rhizovicinus]|nr:alcohol dehydrogenase catalytic domain-containing protein [Paenibacillus rhizovicinus]